MCRQARWDVSSPAATGSLDLPPEDDQTHILLSVNQINPAEAPTTTHALRAQKLQLLHFDVQFPLGIKEADRR